MEEAKIKAYRVQVTDLEDGETVMDNITPACLCVTFVDGNESRGEYSSTVQYKKDKGHVRSCKSGESVNTRCTDYVYARRAFKTH